jgi:hypothetical protein
VHSTWKKYQELGMLLNLPRSCVTSRKPTPTTWSRRANSIKAAMPLSSWSRMARSRTGTSSALCGALCTTTRTNRDRVCCYCYRYCSVHAIAIVETATSAVAATYAGTAIHAEMLLIQFVPTDNFGTITCFATL